MGNFKMLCLDIDGTLLNSQHQITEKTVNIIQQVVKEKNLLVILVSARMPKGIWFLQKELKVRQPIISYNGALVITNNLEQLSSLNISISDVKKVYKLAQELKLHMSLYKDDNWYVDKMDKWAKEESEITNIKPNILKFDDLISSWKSGANKLLCIGTPEKIKVLEEQAKVCSLDKLTIYRSKPTYLEIIPKAASKTTAIKTLQEKFNIKREEVIAIGDNYNDIDMLTYAGLGVAMGNSPQEVKKAANEVTRSNDNDGVAEAIREYILN